MTYVFLQVTTPSIRNAVMAFIFEKGSDKISYSVKLSRVNASEYNDAVKKDPNCFKQLVLVVSEYGIEHMFLNVESDGKTLKDAPYELVEFCMENCLRKLNVKPIGRPTFSAVDPGVLVLKAPDGVKIIFGHFNVTKLDKIEFRLNTPLQYDGKFLYVDSATKRVLETYIQLLYQHFSTPQVSKAWLCEIALPTAAITIN